jgi:3-methyladenine DNA glycosylase/8-oxoguanine DNA glycosylase
MAGRSQKLRAKNPRQAPFDRELAIQTLSKKDKKLAKLIAKVGPFNLEPEPFNDTFEHLLESIVYQQLTGKAAATIYTRVKGLFGSDKHPSPQQIIKCSIEELRSAGLSNSKALAIKDLADKTHQGHIPTLAELHLLSDDEIIEKLTTVRGIGPWTVHMLLIFGMLRPDVLPATDYGVRKGFALTYGKEDLPTTKELVSHAECWRPYRSVASWYMWRALDS